MALFRGYSSATSMICNNYKFCVNITKLDLQQRQPVVKNKQFLLKHMSTKKAPEGRYNLQKYISKRKSEALRSIIVQVASYNSCKDLLCYCTNLGPVVNAFYYTLPNEHQFILMEFKNFGCVDNVYKDALFMDLETYVPSRTNVLWFRKNQNIQKYDSQIVNKLPEINLCPHLTSQENEIANAIASSSSISDQIMTLHKKYKSDELEIRLKYITIMQLEKCFRGFFPNIIIQPFGSFVSGFGKKLSDLDLILFTDGYKNGNLKSRLVFHGKSTNVDEKQQTHAFMGVIADSMKYIIPGIFNVRKIFNARVPIIKFQNYFTYTECDLSMNKIMPIYMTELLFIYAEKDYRIKPLIFTIRKWAEDNKLTSIHPGKTITNFSLTLLVIFYLQQIDILPVINTVEKSSELPINNTNNFKSVYSHFTSYYSKHKTNNDGDLNALLVDFFKFYSGFNFNTREICLRTGMADASVHNAALYIRNPFESKLNVSKNVSFNEVQRMKSLMSLAIINLQNSGNVKTSNWGILSILNFPEKNKSTDLSKVIKNTTTDKEIVTPKKRTATSIQNNDVTNALNTEIDNVIINKNVM
ncbi:hypothetical protein M0802_012038 [Mischocyttarus mexicanus]|nr:hypothetical protein M0802_012038 [Mischocyttarus mexicanus]